MPFSLTFSGCFYFATTTIAYIVYCIRAEIVMCRSSDWKNGKFMFPMCPAIQNDER